MLTHWKIGRINSNIANIHIYFLHLRHNEGWMDSNMWQNNKHICIIMHEHVMFMPMFMSMFTITGHKIICICEQGHA